MASPAKTIHVLTGPTAVGKTALALDWAEQNNAEIVSCDSLLFYQGMDIGTAKPTRAERARVPHHLIDIVSPTERMDIADYVRRARATVDGIYARGRAILVTGGSGFYLKAFFRPVADEVVVPASIREAVAADLERAGLSVLVERLRALNPDGLGELDTANPRRVTRALERCLTSGRTLADMAAEFARMPSAFADYTVSGVVLTREQEDLDRRIRLRIDAMLADGLIDEVQRLREAGFEGNPSACLAIGYRETLEMLEGRLASAELAEMIARNTRGLVKKQRTWFRTQLPELRAVDATRAHAAGLFAVGN